MSKKKETSRGGNNVHETPAGIVHWVDPEFSKHTPEPGSPEASFSIKSSGGGKAHLGQLRSLIDNEKKGK